MNYKILLIDDSKLDIETTLGEFASEGDLEFTTVSSAEKALEHVRRSPDAFAVILLDYNMPNANGDSVAKDLLTINNRLNIVILSGDPSQAAVINTMKAGAVDFIDKNLPADQKIPIVRSYCRKFDEVCRVVEFQENDSERAKMIEKAGFVGRSKAMAEIAEQIFRMKESSSTALIRGPSGVGKELVARAIHNNSTRKGRPFVAVNCGAIAEGLLESELFGHEKGAFTNAINKKIGKFQVANFGTIFLDEVGDMPLPMQVKILRALQEGTIDPVGARESVHVNVRIIAATNKNLEEAVENGTFREDLYYRLNVIPFHVPALAERREDIEPLVAHFVRSHQTGSHKKILYGTLKYFLDYPWKGNVRELENTIDRLLTLTVDDYISPRHLEPKFFNNHVAGIDFDCDWKTFLEQKNGRESDLERQYLVYHLSKSKSVRDAAVSALKMNKATLQNRIEDLGIDVREILKVKEREYAEALG